MQTLEKPKNSAPAETMSEEQKKLAQEAYLRFTSASERLSATLTQSLLTTYQFYKGADKNVQAKALMRLAMSGRPVDFFREIEKGNVVLSVERTANNIDKNKVSVKRVALKTDLAPIQNAYLEYQKAREAFVLVVYGTSWDKKAQAGITELIGLQEEFFRRNLQDAFGKKAQDEQSRTGKFLSASAVIAAKAWDKVPPSLRSALIAGGVSAGVVLSGVVSVPVTLAAGGGYVGFRAFKALVMTTAFGALTTKALRPYFKWRAQKHIAEETKQYEDINTIEALARVHAIRQKHENHAEMVAFYTSLGITLPVGIGIGLETNPVFSWFTNHFFPGVLQLGYGYGTYHGGGVHSSGGNTYAGHGVNRGTYQAPAQQSPQYQYHSTNNNPQEFRQFRGNSGNPVTQNNQGNEGLGRFRGNSSNHGETNPNSGGSNVSSGGNQNHASGLERFRTNGTNNSEATNTSIKGSGTFGSGNSSSTGSNGSFVGAVEKTPFSSGNTTNCTTPPIPPPPQVTNCHLVRGGYWVGYAHNLPLPNGGNYSGPCAMTETGWQSPTPNCPLPADIPVQTEIEHSVTTKICHDGEWKVVDTPVTNQEKIFYHMGGPHSFGQDPHHPGHIVDRHTLLTDQYFVDKLCDEAAKAGEPPEFIAALRDAIAKLALQPPQYVDVNHLETLWTTTSTNPIPNAMYSLRGSVPIERFLVHYTHNGVEYRATMAIPEPDKMVISEAGHDRPCCNISKIELETLTPGDCAPDVVSSTVSSTIASTTEGANAQEIDFMKGADHISYTQDGVEKFARLADIITWLKLNGNPNMEQLMEMLKEQMKLTPDATEVIAMNKYLIDNDAILTHGDHHTRLIDIFKNSHGVDPNIG